MITTSTFPVIVGTVVEVSCKPGHSLAGDNTITCIKDVSFNIGQRPTCTIGLIDINFYDQRSQSNSQYRWISLIDFSNFVIIDLKDESDQQLPMLELVNEFGQVEIFHSRLELTTAKCQLSHASWYINDGSLK